MGRSGKEGSSVREEEGRDIWLMDQRTGRSWRVRMIDLR